MENLINFPDLIGKGYGAFWRNEQRYRVVKGGRGSKKSATTTLNLITRMMKFYEVYGIKPNTLVIRKYSSTHRDSTFAQLKWAINKLGVAHLWKAYTAPLELKYLPSGQKIIFRGMDEPESVTSITVDSGYLCWVWWEEAYQIESEEAFNKIDLAIRGEMPKPLFKQHTIILNPWNEKTWIKPRFFDTPDDDVFAITRNYDCNEFLGADDIRLFEKMKINNPRRYLIEGLGEWGISEGLIFYNFIEKMFDYEYMKRQKDANGNLKYSQFYGLDFGYSNDPSALICILVDEVNFIIYIYDEIYKPGLKNRQIHAEIKYKGYEKVPIAADSASPQVIDELRDYGLTGIFGCKKVTINQGIHKLQDYKFIVHPRCQNVMVELNNYSWKKDRLTNKTLDEPIDEYNHLMDALRYATQSLQHETFSW